MGLIGAVNLAGAIESEDRSPSFRNLLARCIPFSRISSFSSVRPSQIYCTYRSATYDVARADKASP